MRRGEPAPPRARDEMTGPFGRIDQQVAPHDRDFEPCRPPKQNARHGEDTRLYRRTRVKAS